MWLTPRYDSMNSVVNEWRFLRLRIAGRHNIIRVASGVWSLRLCDVWLDDPMLWSYAYVFAHNCRSYRTLIASRQPPARRLCASVSVYSPSPAFFAGSSEGENVYTVLTCIDIPLDLDPVLPEVMM